MGKVGAYLGFARRAGKLVLGVNAIKAVKGRVYLLAVSESAAPNTLKEIEGLKRRFSCPAVTVEDLEGLVGKPNCKLAAVREEHLAAAILGEIQGGSEAKKQSRREGTS